MIGPVKVKGVTGVTGPSSALDTLHYLRQASFIIVGLVEVVALMGNSCAISGELQWPWRGDSSPQPSMGVLCQQNQWPGHPYSMAWRQHQIVPELYFAYEEKIGLFGG